MNVLEVVEVLSEVGPCLWILPRLPRFLDVSVFQCFALTVGENHLVVHTTLIFLEKSHISEWSKFQIFVKINHLNIFTCGFRQKFTNLPNFHFINDFSQYLSSLFVKVQKTQFFCDFWMIRNFFGKKSVSYPYSKEPWGKVWRKLLEPFLRNFVNQPTTTITGAILWALGDGVTGPKSTFCSLCYFRKLFP